MKKIDHTQVLTPIEVQVLWLFIGFTDKHGRKLPEEFRHVELGGFSKPRRFAAEALVRKGVIARTPGGLYVWSGNYFDLIALRRAYPLKSIKD